MKKTDIDDGGYAFPCAGHMGVNPESVGMTLRDYFAASVIQGMFASMSDVSQLVAAKKLYPNGIEGEFARCAYSQADAMLKARGA